MPKKLTALLAPLAVAALLIPAAAGAHAKPTLSSVKQHIKDSEAELAIARRDFARNRQTAGQVEFGYSRDLLGFAKSDANALAAGADNASERANAALALGTLAATQNTNVEELLALAPYVRFSLKDDVVQAALSDARGRDRALGRLQELVDNGIPARVRGKITRAITALSRGHEGEAAAAARLLSEGALTPEAQTALRSIVESQRR